MSDISAIFSDEELDWDVTQQLVFEDDPTGILNVGFLAPPTSPVKFKNEMKCIAWASDMLKAIDVLFYPTGEEVPTRLGWISPPLDSWDLERYGWCHEMHRDLPNCKQADLYIHQDFTVEVYSKKRA
jgi:hypothetical protein